MRVVKKAYDAIHELNVALHYLSCDGAKDQITQYPSIPPKQD